MLMGLKKVIRDQIEKLGVSLAEWLFQLEAYTGQMQFNCMFVDFDRLFF